MGVPYDVPNRDEVIKEKARKLAVQGNTLWLATAGFATPIMTGLICKGLEPVVNNLKQKYDLKSAQKILNGQKALPSAKAQEKAFEEFLSANMGKKLGVTNELISKFNWSTVISPNMPDVLRKDLSKVLENVPNEVTHEYVDEMFMKLAKPLAKAGINKDEVITAFKKNGIFGNGKDLLERYRAYNYSTDAMNLSEITHEVLNKLIDKKNLSPEALENVRANITIGNIENLVQRHNTKVLDEQTAGYLRKVFKELSTYFKQETVLKKWEDAHYAPNADSLGAYSWKKGAKTILSVLDLSKKEMSAMTKEGSVPAKIVEEKIAEIASDPKRYKEVVSKIGQAIAEYDSILDDSARSQYRQYVNNMCSNAQESLERLGFSSTARYIGGDKILEGGANYKEAISGSLRNLRHTNFDERVLSQRSSMYRFLQALDLERRFNTMAFEAQFDVVVPEDMPKIFRPRWQEVTKRAKAAIMDASLNEHANKFGGKAINTYKTVMRLLYGAFPEKYVKDAILRLSKAEYSVGEALENSIEAGYRAAEMIGCSKTQLARYKTALDKDTVEALYEASVKAGRKTGKNIDLIENIKTYFQTFIDNVVNAKSELVNGFDLTGQHDLKGAMKGLAGSESPSLKSSLIGAKPYEIVKGAAQDAVVSKKWLKKFGIAGAVILAGTVLATTFFGHIPEKEMYMSDSKKKNKPVK